MKKSFQKKQQSYNFNQLPGQDRMGRAAVEKSDQKLVFFRALHQSAKAIFEFTKK